jgi:hypothetical protein
VALSTEESNQGFDFGVFGETLEKFSNRVDLVSKYRELRYNLGIVQCSTIARICCRLKRYLVLGALFFELFQFTENFRFVDFDLCEANLELSEVCSELPKTCHDNDGIC